MKFSIERDRLLKPLTGVNGVIERRQTLPILANVLISLRDGMLTFIGTDLEVEIKVQVDKIKGEDGEVTVPGRKILDITRALPENTKINIETKENQLVIKSGRSRFNLQTLPADDFPSIDTEDWNERVTVQEGVLRDLIDRTAFAMAQQDVRYYLNGLLLEFDGDVLRSVATDGHRLAKTDVSMESKAGELLQVIMPRKAVMELVRLLELSTDPVTMEISQNHLRLHMGDTQFTTKLIEGRFPDYEAVISPVLSKLLLLNRSDFTDSLARTAILTNEKFRGVRLNVETDKIEISANNPEQEQAKDEIAVDYKDDPVEIGFNVSYLLDALRAIPTTEVEFRLQDTNSSCTLAAPGDKATLYLIMPMRL